MTLLAGAAELDITPPAGTHLGGDLCRYRPVREVADPIYAKALVLADESGRRLCVLSLDLCVMGNEWAAEIRRRVGEKLGLPACAVMLHCTQNHSAPSLGQLLFQDASPYITPECWWLCGGDPHYPDFVVPRILEAVQTAAEALAPVTVRHASGVDGRVAFNRRFIKRDGTVQTIPRSADLPDVLQVEGPTDPEVAVVAFYDSSGRMVAALLHHTAHPVSRWTTNEVTASWPGRWCDRFKDAIGPGCVPLVINGCCGNISTHNPLDPDHRSDDDHIAECLTQTTAGALGRLADLAAPPTLQCKSEVLGIARPACDPAELEEARAVLERWAEPQWLDKEHARLDPEWTFAALLLDMAENYRKHPVFPCEVQAFRIGDVALVGLMGEPFVEGQLTVKLISPAARTLVAHQCNGYVGYIPTREACARFNYNYYADDGRPVRRGATRLVLAPEAMDMILDASQLWPQPAQRPRHT